MADSMEEKVARIREWAQGQTDGGVEVIKRLDGIMLRHERNLSMLQEVIDLVFPEEIEGEMIDGRLHKLRPDGTCSGCNEVMSEFFDHVEGKGG